MTYGVHNELRRELYKGDCSWLLRGPDERSRRDDAIMLHLPTTYMYNLWPPSRKIYLRLGQIQPCVALYD